MPPSKTITTDDLIANKDSRLRRLLPLALSRFRRQVANLTPERQSLPFEVLAVSFGPGTQTKAAVNVHKNTHTHTHMERQATKSMPGVRLALSK